ncbi:MAG: hypothetical protein GY794_24740, partial [bacterium]|nr:hypothetical protein [bacterium]
LRRGVVYILSLAVLALCTTMAVAMASGTSVNITRNDNMQNALNAQLAAEGGLQFMLQSIANADMPTSTTYDTLMTDMATGLGELMNDTANLSGSEVSGTSTTVTIPTISVEGATFACTLTRIASDTEGNLQCQLSVTGTSGGMSRSISVNLALSSAAPGTFGYGIATKGIVDISGNASILSMSDASDASIFSAADDTVVISASGNSTIDGDLYACTDEISAIQLTGNSEVGGETDTDEILASHTHLSQTEPDFPEFDLSPFPGLTTDVVDSSTRTSGNV